MSGDRKSIVVSVPGASPNVVLDATQTLINELNEEFGPGAAARHEQDGRAGDKGDVVSLGQIILAMVSAGMLTQIAHVLINYIKRNPRYILQVGEIKITKDHASTSQVELINSLVKELASRDTKSK